MKPNFQPSTRVQKQAEMSLLQGEALLGTSDSLAHKYANMTDIVEEESFQPSSPYNEHLRLLINAKKMFVLQVFYKAIQFLHNFTVMNRPEWATYGIVAIRLEFFYFSIVTLARVSTRQTLKKIPRDKLKESRWNLIGVSLLVVPMGIVISTLFFGWAFVNFPTSIDFAQFTHTLTQYFIALVIELFAEPFYNCTQLLVDGYDSCLLSIFIFLLKFAIIWAYLLGEKSCLNSYASAQLICSIVVFCYYLLLYIIHFSNQKASFDNFWEFFRKFWSSHWHLWQLYVFKFLLSQCDMLVGSIVFSESEQAFYATVIGYTASISKMFIAPLEEIGCTKYDEFYSECNNQVSSKCSVHHSNFVHSMHILSLIVAILVSFGKCLSNFFSLFSPNQKFQHDFGKFFLLTMIQFTMLSMANLLDNFLLSFVSMKSSNYQRLFNVSCFIVYFGTAILLVPYLHCFSVVLANFACFMMRIMYSFYIIRKYRRDLELKSFIFPSPNRHFLIIAFILGLIDKLFHCLFTAASLVFILLFFFYVEKKNKVYSQINSTK